MKRKLRNRLNFLGEEFNDNPMLFVMIGWSVLGTIVMLLYAASA